MSHNAVDLTGKKFGKLTVIGRGRKSPSGNTYWLCKCSCSAKTEKEIIGTRLTGSSKTKSCGCVKNDKHAHNFIDLTGKVFGRWTVLRFLESKPRSTWECQCSCENKTLKKVTANSLLTGRSTSCGCNWSGEKNPNFKDLTGLRFGRLVVIKRVGWYVNPGSGGKIGKWLCLCDCGKECKKITSALMYNKEKNSCGCLHRENCLTAHRLPQGKAGFNAFLRACQSGAKRRGIVWELSDDFVFKISQQPCFYCGAEPYKVRTIKSLSDKSKEWAAFRFNGLDRYINTDGYTEKNTVPCCWTCNDTKGATDGPEFISWIKQVAENLSLVRNDHSRVVAFHDANSRSNAINQQADMAKSSD